MNPRQVEGISGRQALGVIVTCVVVMTMTLFLLPQ